jgi:uncharacterized repeat protein (TIGR02543 family)
VQYDSNGGDGGATLSGSYTYDVSTPLTKNGFTRTGYTFLGWATSADGPKAYDDGQDVQKLTAINGNTVTLYAKWSSNTYTVQYDSNGGDGGMTPQSSHTYDIPAPLTKNGFTRTDYTFAGWATSASGTIAYTDGQTVKSLASHDGATVTLYAIWTAQTPSANLLRIALSAGKLSPAFSQKVTSYTVNLGELDSGVTVTPVKTYDGAKLIINGITTPSVYVPVANGKSVKMTIKVSFGKLTKTYALSIKRAKSSDDKLSSLAYTAGSLSAVFDPEVTLYTLTLPEGTAKVTLKAAKESPLATVTPASKAYTPKNGQTVKATIKVKSQSGATKTYTVMITRDQSTNAALASLKTSLKQCPLVPAFNADILSYTVTLPAKTSSIQITCTVADKLASVSIDGAKRISETIKLSSGQSVPVTVTVTSQAGNTKTYTIIVGRQ